VTQVVQHLAPGGVVEQCGDVDGQQEVGVRRQVAERRQLGGRDGGDRRRPFRLGGARRAGVDDDDGQVGDNQGEARQEGGAVGGGAAVGERFAAAGTGDALAGPDAGRRGGRGVAVGTGGDVGRHGTAFAGGGSPTAGRAATVRYCSGLVRSEPRAARRS